MSEEAKLRMPGADESPAPSASQPRSEAPKPIVDPGLAALTLVSSHYRIPTDPYQIAHDLGLARFATAGDIVRAATRLGLKARLQTANDPNRLLRLPTPAILGLKDGAFAILVGPLPNRRLQVVDPVRQISRDLSVEEFAERWNGEILLVTRRAGGPGVDPKSFGFKWFLPAIWRYRKPLGHVIAASLFLQIFALITPLMFQVIVDKVLLHRSFSTLLVIIVGMIGIGLFDVILQYLRSYVLNHTTSRIDVALGARLFDHLMRLPLAYFETRAAGQTVARVRELETVRAFLTGQGLSSVIDVFFAVVLIAVLFLYSPLLTLVVVCSIPLYIIIAVLVRPLLKEKIDERFNRGAASQQFLVETVFGMQTLKSAAVEPVLRNQWEEKLAAYVRASFQAATLASGGQNAIQYVSKATQALVLYLGALAVINSEMTVGGLVAFNMIMNQVTAPILRLSQLWQDFQQVQVSVERLGDILNYPPETTNLSTPNLAPARGAIKFSGVHFRYTNDQQDVLRNIDLEIPAGQVIGIVGPSGSGKSTLTKLLLRLYRPERGQVFLDGVDVTHVDTAWLRRQIAVVLQENVLFNRTIHENIALAAPGLSRQHVMHVAKLAGADEFISRMPQGYETKIEERGANLSGGQRQRIAIARALATQPRILVLDEATSALDYESERILQDNMRQITQGRTVIVIAHRLAAVRNCDRIIAVQEGEIVEDGPHAELLRKPNGLYARLWQLQAERSES